MYPVNFPTKPQFLWKRFYDFTQLPRPSKKEGKVREYLIALAKEKNLEYKEDACGNIVIYVPASKNCQSQETIIIQNHMDMVCDHLPEIKINFEEDPLEILVLENKVKAKGTTLGADNGIGCAAALAILDEPIEHPPLELLFTVDEETGLHGANNLDASLLSGKKMINLDTEDFGSFFIGCAGGLDFDLERPVMMSYEDGYFLKISVSGLIGGHSGIDIHRNRGNAIKILNECLMEINLRGIDFKLSEMSGGKAKNIIPRDASAIIMVNENDIDNIEAMVGQVFDVQMTRISDEEENFKIDIEHFGVQNKKVLSKDWTRKILDLHIFLPHGAYDYIWESKQPLVRFSSNLAVTQLKDGIFYVLSSLRFTEREDIQGLVQNIKVLAKRFGLKVFERGGYPGWKPDFDSQLLKSAIEVFKNNFSTEPEVAAIHAGLECGILKDKIGQIDCISFGPNIRGAHSPDEYVEIDSVEKFWSFLVSFLNKLSLK